MKLVDQRERESWRMYTKHLAKLNHTTRRRVVRKLRKLAHS